jgi:UDP-N-acetylmuramoyl-tripeptide--D-alanyl-D-alanine ligase
MVAQWGKVAAEEIAAAVKGQINQGDPGTPFLGFNSDSRTVQRGDVFWALKGDRFDGHDFVSKAALRGATGVVVQKGFQISSENLSPMVLITVDDTLRALGDFAGWWRRQHNAKVAAITGSSGKTTAKEMTAAILQMGDRTLKNQGNHNNLIGLPATLLKLEASHRRAVLEMGMNRRGEIARLTEIANPDAAVILNVGMAHLEGLGSIDGVAEAKTELIAQSSPETRIILNGDDGVLMKHAARFKRRFITFGLKEGNSIRGTQIKPLGSGGISFDLGCEGSTRSIRLSVPGVHNVKNALAAAAVARCFDEPFEHIAKGLADFEGVQGRFQSIPLGKKILLIDDSYNANPSALKAVLQSALAMVKKEGRFIVALGDMLELGETAVSAHYEAGGWVAQSDASWFFAMGAHAEEMRKGAIDGGMPSNYIRVAKTHDELTEAIIQKIEPGDVILLKGSRKMQFERVSEGLKRHFGSGSGNL